MKFITTSNPEPLEEEIFLFPNSVDHDTLAEALHRIRNQSHGNWHRVHREPISAGFVSVAGECHGKSETLSLSARPEDTDLLAKTFSSM